MSPFEFFFSLFGLVLGLSISVIASGLATAIQHRRTVRIGWLTPLLAAFVALDIASFWETAWQGFRDLPFSYGLLVAGLVIALVYFVAASLVFPHRIEDGASLDDHFWANKRPTLLLMVAANTLLLLAMAAVVQGTPRGRSLLLNYGATWLLYVLLILPAALSRRRALVATLIGLHTVIYLLLAAATLADPGRGGTAPTSRPAR